MEHLSDEQLSALLDGDLSAGEESASNAHVAVCGRCRAALNELTVLRDAAAALPELEPSARVDCAIRRAVLDNRPARRSRLDWAWAGLPAAAMLVLAIVLAVGRRGPGAPGRGAVPSEVAAASAVDIEQYMSGLDQAIDECEVALAENPGNTRVRSAWLAARASRVQSYDRLVSGGD